MDSKSDKAGPSPVTVAIFMGSKSNAAGLRPAIDCLDEFGIAWEARVLSAHRVPETLVQTIKEIEAAGCDCIIAAAGPCGPPSRSHCRPHHPAGDRPANGRCDWRIRFAVFNSADAQTHPCCYRGNWQRLQRCHAFSGNPCTEISFYSAKAVAISRRHEKQLSKAKRREPFSLAFRRK